MRVSLKSVLVAVMLLSALSVSAQRSGRTKDPTLNRGEGLEMNRSDLDKMRNQSQDKNSRIVDIYIFGASFSLIDSVLYVSYPQKMENVTVNNKRFLKGRADLEKQYADYLSNGVESSQMSTIYFSEKLEKLEKSRARLIKRNSKKNRFDLVQMPEFQFTAIPEEE
jgi:hypothetical protein